MNVFRRAWFPYIFALGAPLTIYSHNQAAFNGDSVLRPTLVFLLVAALLVIVFRRVIASRALADTLAVIPIIGVWILGIGWQLYLVLLLTVLAGIFFRKRHFTNDMVPVFNALSIGVVILPVISIIQVESAAHNEHLQKIDFSPFSNLQSTQMSAGKPDIYHIVLDAYGGSDALSGELGFDNSAFFDDLRSLDFIVNESVVVPYNETVHTMSSVFLGEYLRQDEFPIDTESPTELRSTLGSLIANSPVHSILRENDYTIAYTDPGHEFLRFPDDAVLLRSHYNTPMNRFELHLGTTLGLYKIFPDLYVVTLEDPLIVSMKSAFAYDYSEVKSPKFAYQHVIAPHSPFIIDRDGARLVFPGFTSTAEGDRVVLGDPERRKAYVLGYLEKLRFVNDKVLEQIRTLRELPGKKIIVLHGDHGSGSKYYLDDPGMTCLRERFTSFLAVYSDDPDIRDEFGWIPEPGSTPVNLYRSILNVLLDLDLEMLPNRSSFVRYATPHVLEPIDSAQIPLACDSAN